MSKYQLNSNTFWHFTALYAVLINPWHPTIQEFLHRLLTEASDHVNVGEKFCLKVKCQPEARGSLYHSPAKLCFHSSKVLTADK